MKLQTAFQKVSRVFLDTAPVIYYVEKNPKYFDVVSRIFEGVDDGEWEAITSPVTLAESLVVPYRQGLTELQKGLQRFDRRGRKHNLPFNRCVYRPRSRKVTSQIQPHFDRRDSGGCGIARWLRCFLD